MATIAIFSFLKISLETVKCFQLYEEVLRFTKKHVILLKRTKISKKTAKSSFSFLQHIFVILECFKCKISPFSPAAM